MENEEFLNSEMPFSYEINELSRTEKHQFVLVPEEKHKNSINTIEKVFT